MRNEERSADGGCAERLDWDIQASCRCSRGIPSQSIRRLDPALIHHILRCRVGIAYSFPQEHTGLKLECIAS